MGFDTGDFIELIALKHKSLLKNESYQRGIIFSSFFNILSKSVLFLNSILIAFYFGAGEGTDVYFFVFSVTTLVAYFISAMNISVVVPESMRIREQQGPLEGMAFLNIFLYIYIGISLLITLIMLIDPITIYSIFSKFPDKTLDRYSGMLLWAIPLFTLMILANFFTEIMASYKFFSMPMIAQFVNNLLVLAFILLFQGILDVKSMLFGLIVAYILNLLILLVLMKRELNWRFLYHQVKIRPKVRKDILYAQLGNITSLLSSFAPTYVFSRYPGALTSFNYGQKTSLMPNDLITGQIASVAGIRFNELFAQNNMKQVNVVFADTARFLTFILLPVTGLFFLLSSDIISFLFERGKFSGQSVELASLFMKYLGMLLPMLALNALITRIIISAGLLKHSFWIQMASNLFLVLLIYLGTKYYGYIGYPLALIIQNVIAFIAVIIMFRFVLPDFKPNKVIIYLCLQIIINFVITCLLYLLIVNVLADLQLLMRMIIVLSLYGLIIITAGFIFKLNERFNKMIVNILRKITGLKGI